MLVGTWLRRRRGRWRVRWLAGGDAWSEWCLEFFLLSFMWVEVEGMFRVVVEEASWRERKGAFILHVCNNMDSTVSGLFTNPTTLCLTILTSSVYRCRLCVVDVSCPAVAPKTGGQTRYRTIRGRIPQRSFARLFFSTSRCSSINRVIVF